MMKGSGDAMRSARVTIRDVAEFVDVHVSTVSRALDPDHAELVSHETRERVRRAAKELGYSPDTTARGLRRGRTNTVGVVVPNLSNAIYAPLTRGIAHALDRRDYVPFVADTEDNPERVARILQRLYDRRVDAIATTAVRADNMHAFLDIASRGIPVVTAVRTVASTHLAAVTHDDRAGAGHAAQHLLDLGHTRLGRIRGPADVALFERRSRGFAEVVAERGAQLVRDVPPAMPRSTVAEGFRIATALLSRRSPPTALFAQNDESAIGALQAVRELGLRCPEDVSIVGYNDVPAAEHLYPPLTTIRIDAYAIGRDVGQLALALVDDPATPSDIYRSEPALVVRGSTGPVPSP